jgi:DNA-binding MarR family transcriptional regulator
VNYLAGVRAGRLVDVQLMPKQPKSLPAACITQGTSATVRIDDACRRIAAGRLAARELSGWTLDAGVSEAEFRLLWILFRDSSAPDQAALAARLAVSPAQISGAVERLRTSSLIELSVDPGDRRRQLWRLAPAGAALVHQVLVRVAAAPKEAA